MKRGFTGVLTFFFLTLSVLPCLSQEVAPEESPPLKTFTSLHKSLLIPGWGQFAEQRYIEGALFLSAEIFALYKVFSYNHEGNNAYAKYKNADNVQDAVKFREMTSDYDTKRNQYLLVAAGVWVVNLIDIYLIVTNKEKKMENPRLKFESGHKSLVLTVSYRF